MLVYLMRHGEAEPKAAKDEARQLTRAGVLASRDVATRFLSRAPIVDKAFVSPLERARQTAAAFRVGLPNLRFESQEMLKPDADVHALLDMLGQSGGTHILLVGHNPCLSKLMCLMLDGITETGRHMGTSDLVCISMEDAIPGFGEILYEIKPSAGP